MVGMPQDILLLCGQLEIAKDLIRRFAETASQVVVERRLDEKLIDAWFRIHSRSSYRGISAMRQPPGIAPALSGVFIRVTGYLRCKKRRVLGSVYKDPDKS